MFDKKEEKIRAGGIEEKGPAKENSALKHRKLRYGGIATLFTVLFIVAAIAANYLIGYLTDRYVLEIDMTTNALYEISADTKEVIMNLSEPITITVLADETTYESTELLSRIREVLQRYDALGGDMITVRYMNPTVNPAIREKYNSLGDLSSNDIIIEGSKRYKYHEPTDLYNIKTGEDGTTRYLVGLRAEQKLTSALLFVTADKIPKAAYIKGHGEAYSLGELDKLLAGGNYDVVNLNLADSDIPEDVDMVILSSPSADYTAAEIEKLDDFLSGGGNAIVSMSSEVVKRLDNLERYFEEWGVEYKQRVVLDMTKSLSGYPTYILPDVAVLTGLTDNLPRSTYAVIAGARQMRTLFEQNGWRTTKVLMTSSTTSYSKSMQDAITSLEKADTDEAGPFPVAIISTNTMVDSNAQSTYSHVLFINASLISDETLKMDNFLNSRYMVAAINYMSTDADTVIIKEKAMTVSTLSLEGGQMVAIFWIMIIAIPFGCLAFGIVVWFRRRHL